MSYQTFEVDGILNDDYINKYSNSGENIISCRMKVEEKDKNGSSAII